MQITVRCPAKVNRFLSVGPPMPSGFHPIRTILQAISLFDSLAISETATEEVICDWADLPGQNTLTKTLRLAREFTDVPPLRIELKKQIPAESGLAGGSTDAAGLLRALMKLTDGRLQPQDAHQIASAVGKDVPFFLVGGVAKATGFGEVIEPLPDREPEHILIVRPNVGVSTQSAYAALDSTDREWREFPSQGESYNDFERVAPCECLELLERLRAIGAAESLLCGSGSAVYGAFESEKFATAAGDIVRSEGYDRVWVARTLTREESLWMSWS